MSEETRKIVKMLKDGQITEDEAVRLLESATKTAPPQSEVADAGCDVQQHVVEAVKSVKDYLNLPDSVWHLARLIVIALLFLVVLSWVMRIMGIWHPVFLIGVPVLVLVLLLLREGREGKTRRREGERVASGPKSVKEGSTLPGSAWRLALLTAAAGLFVVLLLGNWHAPVVFGIPVLILVLLLLAATRPGDAPLNWPGLIWRLALLVGIAVLALVLANVTTHDVWVGRSLFQSGRRLPYIRSIQNPALFIGIAVLLFVLVLVAIAKRPETRLNWPGLIWRLALLITIPLFLFFLMYIAAIAVPNLTQAPLILR